MRCRSSTGWLLVGLIVLISAVILALVGITFYLTEHLRTTSLRQNQTRAIYLAQAGVMRELYDFRRGNGVSLNEVTVTAGPLPGAGDDDVYDLSGPPASPQTDVLLVNMRGDITFPTPVFLCPASGKSKVQRDRIGGWSMTNILASGESTLTITAMRINWSPVVDGEGVLSLELNNAVVWVAPGCTTGTPTPAGPNTLITFTSPQSLSAGTRWAGTRNKIWFTTTTMEVKDWIDLTFLLSDGSSRTARWDRLTLANRTADFTLRSQGIVRRGAFPFSVWRRLKADHRICRSDADMGGNCNDRNAEQQREGKLIGYAELTTLTP